MVSYLSIIIDTFLLNIRTNRFLYSVLGKIYKDFIRMLKLKKDFD